MLVIIYSKLLILDVRQKDTKSYRPPLARRRHFTEESHVRVPLGAGAPRSNCVREDELAKRFAQVAIPGFPKRISQGVLGGRALGSMAPTVFFADERREKKPRFFAFEQETNRFSRHHGPYY